MVRDGQLQAGGIVADVKIARGTLVKAVDNLAEVSARQIPMLPPLEGLGDRQERPSQLLVVRSPGILTEEALDPLWRVCHTLSL